MGTRSNIGIVACFLLTRYQSAAVIVGLGEEADTQLAYLESRGLTKKDVEAHKEIEGKQQRHVPSFKPLAYST